MIHEICIICEFVKSMPVVGARHQSSRIKSDLHIRFSGSSFASIRRSKHHRLPFTAWLLADNVADTSATPQVSAKDISVSVLQPPMHSFHHDVLQQISHQRMHLDFSIFSVFEVASLMYSFQSSSSEFLSHFQSVPGLPGRSQ